MADGFPLEQFLRLTLQGMTLLEVEQVPLSAAVGRVLAWDMTALENSPPTPLAAVDGYALRTADLNGARRSRPVKLMVSDLMGEGLAVPVSAGEVLPAGCDGVIRRTDTDGGSPALSVYRELWPYENYIRPGADYRAGEPLFPAGTRLTAAGAAVLTGAGHQTAPVRRTPGIWLDSTGDAPEEATLFLSARLKELGAALVPRESAQLLLLLDPHTALQGSQPVCAGMALLPCSNVALSRLGRQPVLTLPTDLTSLFTAVELLVRPVLAFLFNANQLLPQPEKAVLSTSIQQANPVRRFLPGQYKGGKVALSATAGPRSLTTCNCLVDLAAGTPPLSPGRLVRVLLL